MTAGCDLYIPSTNYSVLPQKIYFSSPKIPLSQNFPYICSMELPDITDKNVLIIGCPASGKTYVSGLLDNDKHRVVHTDRYIDLGHKESLYNLLDGLSLYKGLTIVEGVLGYRLLRKGLQTGEYFPDLVIELRVNEETMLDTYKYKRDPLKVKRLKSFNKAHRTILDEYLKLPNDRPPEWYIIQNDY